MIYNSLVLHHNNWDNLTKLKTNNHLPHAFIFFGPEGSGKEGHAIEFSAYLNCRNIQGKFACGACDSCLKIKSFQHGNIKLILPLPKEKALTKNSNSINTLTDKNIKLLRKSLKEKIANPYFKVELPKANQILIHSIQELKRELTLSSAEEGYNLVLIFDAEKLCIGTGSSGNALLKTLEEPPENTLFILITNSIDQLLDTIVSRCLKIYFKKLSDNEISKYLNNDTLDSEYRKVISKIANGNARFAKKILSSEQIIYDYKSLYLNLIFKKKSTLLPKFIELIYEAKQNSHENLKLIFKLGILIIKDCMTYDSLDILNQSEMNEILKKYSGVDWNKIIDCFEDTYKKIIRNGNITLLVSGLIINIEDELN